MRSAPRALAYAHASGDKSPISSTQMCIRDRTDTDITEIPDKGVGGQSADKHHDQGENLVRRLGGPGAVSYTHLMGMTRAPASS